MPEYGHHLSAKAVPDVGDVPLVYAIGDVHGSLQKLRDLMTLCARHADGRPATFVFLGDYIDRGPDSRGVIEALMDLQSRHPDRTLALKGNHEAVAVEIVDGETDAELWLREGGTATLQSYGIDDARARFRSATTTASVFSCMPASIRRGRSARKATTISFGLGSRFFRTRAITAA